MFTNYRIVATLIIVLAAHAYATPENVTPHNNPVTRWQWPSFQQRRAWYVQSRQPVSYSPSLWQRYQNWWNRPHRDYVAEHEQLLRNCLVSKKEEVESISALYHYTDPVTRQRRTKAERAKLEPLKHDLERSEAEFNKECEAARAYQSYVKRMENKWKKVPYSPYQD